jgi:hypothetical protein
VTKQALVGYPDFVFPTSKDWDTSKFLVLSLRTGHKMARYNATNGASWMVIQWH